LAICMIKENHTTAFGNFQWGLICKYWRFNSKKNPFRVLLRKGSIFY
jgi:hypothetical protein